MKIARQWLRVFRKTDCKAHIYYAPTRRGWTEEQREDRLWRRAHRAAKSNLTAVKLSEANE